MSNPDSRFTAQAKTTQERLSSNTVGLVALSDFRKRRAEVLEQQEREAREAASGNGSTPLDTPNRSRTGTPDLATSDASGNAQKTAKKRKVGATKLSFGDDQEDSDEQARHGLLGGKTRTETRTKVKVNLSVPVVPKAVTKAALRREAAEREQLRKEFLQRQEAVKATEIAIPFVFHDGSSIPGGMVRVKKGDFTWVFLDKSRKLGADLGVGEKTNSRREWARVGVDDLMMVRGNVIIPHHYEFIFFIMNKTMGPNNQLLFDYSNQAPLEASQSTDDSPAEPLSIPATKASAKPLVDIKTLEGASDDPSLTKVVDRRWYERNKHIYPASMWQEFDPEKDYQNEVRRDLGGNTFFYS